VANAYNYSNTAQQTTLTGSVTSGATTLQVAATTGFPATTPYILAVDYGAATEELVSVTGVAGTTLTVTRAFSGTSAQSHSIGAVVRHVVNAQDLIDFRTHEAATAAIHGVAGTLVGTSDTQTLSAKTLTSPTINAGALSGTFTGSPTFSGAPIFTGVPSFQGGVSFERATAANRGWSTKVTGDTVDRLNVQVDGRMAWSSGSLAADAVVFRDGPNQLATSDTLWRVYRGAASSAAYSTLVTGDPNARFYYQADGKMFWGPGSATQDTNLYRSAADTLATDDAFVVGGDLSVGATTWTSFTPTWAGLGTGTLSTNVGWYKKLGKIVFVEIYAVWNVAGSGSSGVQVQFPTVPFRDGNGAGTTRQYVFGFIAGSNGGVVDGVCSLPAFAGDSGTTGATIRRFDGINVQGSNFINASIVTIQGWYREQ
jgi:hypothetical protein